MQAWLAAWDYFTSVFNCLPSGKLAHRCPDPSCCNNFDIEVTKTKMRRALVLLPFRSMPSVPQRSKWTNVFPCVIWFILGLATHALPLAWPLAFKSLNVRVVGVKFNEKGFADHVELEQICWRETQSKRAASGETLVTTPSTLPHLLMLGLVMEPIMFLTMWFMKRSAPSARWPSSRGAIHDLACVERSPISKVLQYLSTLLQGDMERLRLLWMREGYASWATLGFTIQCSACFFKLCSEKISGCCRFLNS